jgi:hypothetical protein
LLPFQAVKTNSEPTLILLALGAMLWACAPLNAVTIYFSDDFESGLSQWTGFPGSGVLVAQAGHGQVLTFDTPTLGGDAWSTPSVPVGSYLSFDYTGVGGFIGVNGDWLAGQSGYPGLELDLIYDNDGTWHHYEVLVRTSGSIMVEICDLITPGFQQSAFFDNIVVADQPGAAIPEGGVGLLGILALLGLCGVNHRRQN